MFVHITVPIGGIGLEHTRALPRGSRAEFERTASIDAGSGPYVTITGDDVEATATAFRESASLASVRPLSRAEDRGVYRLSWDGGRPELLRSIDSVGGTVLSASAVDDTASLEIRFPTQAAGARFYAECHDSATPITVRRRADDGGSEATPRDELTDAQREALCLAFDGGYFEVPRRTTLADIADELGVTDNAVSERLRRGIASLMRRFDDCP